MILQNPEYCIFEKILCKCILLFIGSNKQTFKIMNNYIYTTLIES